MQVATRRRERFVGGVCDRGPARKKPSREGAHAVHWSSVHANRKGERDAAINTCQRPQRPTCAGAVPESQNLRVSEFPSLKASGCDVRFVSGLLNARDILDGAAGAGNGDPSRKDCIPIGMLQGGFTKEPSRVEQSLSVPGNLRHTHTTETQTPHLWLCVPVSLILAAVASGSTASS